MEALWYGVHDVSIALHLRCMSLCLRSATDLDHCSFSVLQTCSSALQTCCPCWCEAVQLLLGYHKSEVTTMPLNEWCSLCACQHTSQTAVSRQDASKGPGSHQVGNGDVLVGFAFSTDDIQNTVA